MAKVLPEISSFSPCLTYIPSLNLSKQLLKLENRCKVYCVHCHWDFIKKFKTLFSLFMTKCNIEWSPLYAYSMNPLLYSCTVCTYRPPPPPRRLIPGSWPSCPGFATSSSWPGLASSPPGCICKQQMYL